MSDKYLSSEEKWDNLVAQEQGVADLCLPQEEGKPRETEDADPGAAESEPKRNLFEELRQGIEEGLKYDSEKPKPSLLPFAALEEVTKVLTYGAKKYGPNNWRHVDNGVDRYFNAAMRHQFAYGRGFYTDKESKRPHLAHAVCCLLYILEKELENEKN